MINICCTFIACGMVDDLLEYTGDEEDPFALERYVDINRDATLTQTQLPTQGHTQSSGPVTSSAGPSFSRLPPQMGINALKMIPESKTLKNSESRRTEDSGTRPSSAKQEGGSQSPKTHLLDLHLCRKHKRSSSGGSGTNDHSMKSGGSPSLSPRQNKEGSQSPKGILLDFHLARKHRRMPSGSTGAADMQHSKPGDSPNLSSRSSNVKQEGGTQSPKGHFLDLHLNRKHKRAPSWGQGGPEPQSDKSGDSPSLSSEPQLRDHSPSSDKKIIFFLKSHNPFVALQSLSPSPSHHPRAHQNLAIDEESSLDGSNASSPSQNTNVKYPGHARHSSDTGHYFSPLQHQSAPSTPSKVLNRHSVDLSGQPVRPRSIVVHDHMMEEGFWDI